MFVSGSSIDNCHEATFTIAYAMVIINWITVVGSIICIGVLCRSWRFEFGGPGGPGGPGHRHFNLISFFSGLIIVGIKFCLSIACMVIGGVHLNECENQAAIFLLVNGGVTLLIAIVLISLFHVNHFNENDTLLGLCRIGGAVLVKLGLSIYGSVVIFGKFETQIQPQIIQFNIQQCLFQDHQLKLVTKQPLPLLMR